MTWLSLGMVWTGLERFAILVPTNCLLVLSSLCAGKGSMAGLRNPGGHECYGREAVTMTEVHPVWSKSEDDFVNFQKCVP